MWTHQVAVTTADQAIDKNRKEFRVNLKPFYYLCIPGLFVIAAMAYYGYRYYSLQQRLLEMAKGRPLPDSFPPNWMFYYGPWGFGLFVAIALFVVWYGQYNRKIVVTRQHIQLHSGKSVVKTQWQNLSFTPPPVNKKRFRTALISDGSYYQRIDEFFYPEFDLLVEVITRAKKFARENLTT